VDLTFCLKSGFMEGDRFSAAFVLLIEARSRVK